MRPTLLASVTMIALMGAIATSTRAAPGGETADAEEASRTEGLPSGVAWDEWTKAVKDRIGVAWNARIPQEAKQGARGAVMFRFKVLPDGAFALPETIARSGSKVLIDNAWEAIRKSAPFPIPPAATEAGDDALWITYTFYYNLDARAAKDWDKRARRVLRKRHPEAKETLPMRE